MKTKLLIGLLGSFLLACASFTPKKQCPKGTRLMKGDNIKSQCAPYGIPLGKTYYIQEKAGQK